MKVLSHVISLYFPDLNSIQVAAAMELTYVNVKAVILIIKSQKSRL